MYIFPDIFDLSARFSQTTTLNPSCYPLVTIKIMFVMFTFLKEIILFLQFSRQDSQESVTLSFEKTVLFFFFFFFFFLLCLEFGGIIR